MPIPALVLLGLIAAGAIAFAAWPSAPLRRNAVADLIIVRKGERRLLLMRRGEVLKRYRVSLGRAPVGHKCREGDNRTPEGAYRIDWRKPDSAYHRALHVSYPEERDVAAALAVGADPGGAIMIHGLPNRFGWIGRLHLARDWTRGCVAVTNREIEEIWRAVPDGTPILIEP